MAGAGGAVAAGALLGGRQAQDDPRRIDGSPLETMAHGAVSLGMTAGVIGTAAYLSRGALAAGGLATAKSLGSWYGSGWNQAFKEKSLWHALAHRPVGMTLGGLAGAFAAHQTDSDPVVGAGIGVAVGAAAYPTVRNIAADWKALGQIKYVGGAAKLAAIAGLSIGVAAGARAVLHQPEYESESTGYRDQAGGYEAVPGLRERLAAMSGTGDVVLGLHNLRH